MSNKYLDIGRLEGFLLAHNAPAIVMDSFHYLTNSAFPVTSMEDLEINNYAPSDKSESIEKTPYKYKKPRKPLSEETKKKLRDQLAKARAAKAKRNNVSAEINIDPPPRLKAGKPKN